MRKPRAFFSVGEAREDQEVAENIGGLLRAVGFDVYRATEQGEPGHVEERIREHIRDSDCLVAVLSPRDRISESEWHPAVFVAQEISLAYGFDVPVIALAEENVVVEGLTPYITQYERFDRGQIVAQTPRIVEFLCRCKDRLLETAPRETVPSDDLGQRQEPHVLIEVGSGSGKADEISIRVNLRAGGSG